MRALIADDSVVMRKIIRKVLEQVGTEEILEAADGREAATVAAKNRTLDIILMDWNMPDVLGIDALRAIRKVGIKTPVIMVTTESEKARVLEAIQAGANNYVIKPFKPEVLAGKIRATVGDDLMSGSL